MGSLLPENLCAHRKGAIEELIKGRAREMAAQPQILFGKPTGDHDGPEELLVNLMTSFMGSLSHLLMSSCKDCGVSQIPNQVRSPIVDHRSVDPGESSKRPAAEDRRGCCKRRCTDKHDQGCQATKQVQRIQEAPHMHPTNYFGHHTCSSYSLNDPSQNPLLAAHLLSFSSKTITTQDSEPYSLSFSSKTISTQKSETYSLSFPSMTISTQYTSCPSSASSVRNECGDETVQSNSLSGDLLFQPSQRPQPTIPFFSAQRRHLSRTNAQRRWKMLFSVMRLIRWLSVRRNVARETFLENPQLDASSHEIVSPLYSALDANFLGYYDWQSIDDISNRYEQTLTFASPVASSALCDTTLSLQISDGHWSLQSHDTNSELKSGLHRAVTDILLAGSSDATMYKAQRRHLSRTNAQRRWKMLFSLLRLFSVRRNVARDIFGRAA